MNFCATVILDDRMLVSQAVAHAVRTGLRLVIDADGKSKLVPQVLPGMQPIAVNDKQPIAA